MQCPNCQNEIPDKAAFCGECGHQLQSKPDAVQPEPAPVRQSAPPPQPIPVSYPAYPAQTQKAVPGWVWGLGGALAVTLVGVFVLLLRPMFTQSTPPTQVILQPNLPAPTQAHVLPLPTNEAPPTPEPTQNPWRVIMDEDFSNPSALETAPDSGIGAGKLLMGGRYPQLLTTVQGDFRLSYDYQWSKTNKGGYCRYDAGGFILTYSHTPDPSANGNDSDRRFGFSILDQDKKFASHIYDNIQGDGNLIHDDLYAGSIIPNGVNHVQVESDNGLITLLVNGAVLADDISYPTQGFYHEIYLDSSGDNLGCKDVEVTIDNVVVEEHR